MKPIHALIALVVIVGMLAVPVMATDGSHTYTGKDSEWDKSAPWRYATPIVDEIQMLTNTGGRVYFVSDTICNPVWAKRLMIIPFSESPPIELRLDVSGKAEQRLDIGNYSYVYETGPGSGQEPNTWKQESGDFTIREGSAVYIHLKGPGTSCGGNLGCPAYIKTKINSATYGAQECHEVLVTPAWTEHFGAWAYIGHFPWYVYVGAGHGDYNRVWINHPWPGHWDFQYVAPVEHPAVYETVCTGDYIDVTGILQNLVDTHHSTFVFDNAQNPGGIFDGEGNLLAELTDPAPGQVKTVSIDYTPRCSDPTKITAQEREILTL